MQYGYNDITVATPTHEVKGYCSAAQVEHLLKCFPVESQVNGWWMVSANSRTFDWQPFMQVPGIYTHQSILSGDFFGHKAAIHKRIVHSMNKMRAAFLQSDRTWFMSLEADVLPKPENMEAVLRRLNNTEGLVCLYTNCYPGFIRQRIPLFTKVSRMTLGFTILHRRMMELFKFRYDENLLAAHHDAFLVHDMVNQGYLPHYDPSIEPIHLSDALGYRGWERLPNSETGRS